MYIRDEVIAEALLYKDQCDYQIGKLCEVTIHRIVRYAENALTNKEIALDASIDVEGAFDNTSHIDKEQKH